MESYFHNKSLYEGADRVKGARMRGGGRKESRGRRKERWAGERRDGAGERRKRIEKGDKNVQNVYEN